MEAFLEHYFSLWHPLGYVLVFLGMVIEGDVIFFTAAFLVQRGILSLPLTFISAWSGILIGDALWFYLGRRLAGHTGVFVRFVDRLALPFERLLRDRPGLAFFMAKFLYGANHAIIVRAGKVGIGRKFFLRRNFFAALAWLFIVGGLGYFSGLSASLVQHRLKLVEVILVVGLVMLYGAEYVVRLLVKKSEETSHE